MPLMVLAALAAVVSILRVLAGAPLVPALAQTLVLVLVGIGGVVMGAGHLLRGDEVAARIGWQPRSPFQKEVAAANLALGGMGLVAPLLSAHAMLVAALGYLIFYWGCALTHVVDRRRNANHAELNGGPLVALSFVLPVIVIVLLALSSS